MNALEPLIEKLSSDPAALQRVKSELANSAAPRARFIELAREHDIMLDAKELDQTLLAAHQQLEAAKKGRELSDDELESVSGGLVVIAIIAVPIALLLPAVQKERDNPKPKQSQ